MRLFPGVIHRWSEAHEIGHSIIQWRDHLHLGGDEISLNPTYHAPMEAEENGAAGRLLFLRNLHVWRHVEEVGGDSPMMGAIAYRFPTVASECRASACRGHAEARLWAEWWGLSDVRWRSDNQCVNISRYNADADNSFATTGIEMKSSAASLTAVVRCQLSCAVAFGAASNDRATAQELFSQWKIPAEVSATTGRNRVLIPAGKHGLNYFPDEVICILKRDPLTFTVVADGTYIMQDRSFETAVPVGHVLKPSADRIWSGPCRHT